MVKVKICGVTNDKDAVLAASLGADYIGFNFVKESPRKISDKLAKEIILKLPPFVSAVGVFAGEEAAVVAKTAKKCGLKLIQLHGVETPEYIKELAGLTGGIPVIKAFRIENEQSLEDIKNYLELVSFILLDSYSLEAQGGTGEAFNWDIAVKAKDLGKPVFLAGGLTPDNVGEAIEKVLPFCVDVASGVERLPRRKDYDLMNSFIRSARGLKK